MAANTNPISPITPTAAAFNVVHQLTANTAMDGTGTVNLIMTAGANGSRVNRLVVQHLGTNVATVMRIFLNNGGSNTTATNNTLVAEATIAANTLSQVAASIPVTIPLNMVLAAGYKLNYTIGTTVAAGHAVTAVDAGDY
jgi:hypothetical protein